MVQMVQNQSIQSEINVVDSIIAHEFGESPERIELVDHQGLINRTFQVTTSSQRLITRVRFDFDDLATFQREKKTVDLLRQNFDWTPEIYCVGKVGAHSYSVQQMIEGTVASQYEGDIIPVWRKLGEYSACFHNIEVPGYLYDMHTSPTSDEFWIQPRLDYLEAGSKNPTIVAREVVTPTQFDKIEAAIIELGSLDFKPAINHSNIAPPNVIIDTNGKVHLIDWGTCKGHIAPHLDVAELMTFPHNCAPEHFEAYMEGHGLGDTFLKEHDRVIKIIQLIRLASSATWICNDKPDLEGDLPFHSKRIGEILGHL